MGAQEPVQGEPRTSQPTTLDRSQATLHGVVRNAATGEGLARALVRIEGDANTGVLTDGEGRFQIANLPVGPQIVEVRKPGFRDANNRSESALQGEENGSAHNVLIAAQMPDVVFALAPDGAIRGQVELSTGDAAERITLALAQRTIQDGRQVWRQASITRTRSDGSYRFGQLAEGDYLVYSQPSMASDLDGVPGGAGQRWAYPSVFYADAREPSGAARIHVAMGQEAQANLTLTLEPLHTVTAAVVFPAGASGDHGEAMPPSAVVEGGGRQLGYPVQYEIESHSIQVELPDGNYTLLLTTVPFAGRAGAVDRNAGVLSGSVDVTVAGRAVPNLRVSLTTVRPSAVQVTQLRNGTSVARAEFIEVASARAEGWVDDGMISDFAQGMLPGPLESPVYVRPGSYWLHTHLPQGLCEVAFTAGGANLAREPLIMGLAGPAAPLELTVRDDCASLQVSLPESTDTIAAGEEPFFTVYAVPDFDLTTNTQRVTLRASTGGAAILNGLTPGNYHVYTFAGAVRLAYRDRDAMAKLREAGQAITLSPGTTANLVVEGPQP